MLGRGFQKALLLIVEELMVGFKRRWVAILSWAWAFVVIFRRWDVWLKLAYSTSASLRWVFISCWEAGDNGSFHLH